MLTECEHLPTRDVICGDALEWLAAHPCQPGCSLVTSLPDLTEFAELGLDGWKSWFRAAARSVLAASPPEGITIFYQTDAKLDGRWVDKGLLCQQAGEEAGVPLVWHKIVCRVAPGIATFGRPSFAHLLCFSEEHRAPAAESSPDVLPSAGKRDWPRAMGIDTCRFVAGYIRKRTASRTLVAPFCGQGAVLAVANELGLDAVGIERNRKRAAVARLR